jgi:hypothetical protein
VRDLITDLLDALGLLGIAVGVGAGTAHWIGWFGMAVGGARPHRRVAARARPSGGEPA